MIIKEGMDFVLRMIHGQVETCVVLFPPLPLFRKRLFKISY